MADWTELDTNTLLPGEPLTSAKALVFFENPKAIAEGADDAPRNQLKSLPRLVAGSSVRSTRTVNLLTSATEIILNHGIIQIGTIRASMTRTNVGGSMTISRIRNGTIVTLGTTTSSTGITVDVSVIPGDELRFSASPSGGFTTYTHSATLAVASGDLWPSITAGRLEGNNV